MIKDNELTLKKSYGYTVYASDDEWHSSNKGLYRSWSVASAKAEKAGWYDSKGEVNTTEVWESPDGRVFEVKELVGFIDKNENVRNEMLAQIKSKLTPAELELLGVK